MGLVALLNYSLELGIFDLSNANVVLGVTSSGRSCGHAGGITAKCFFLSWKQSRLSGSGSAFEQ